MHFVMETILQTIGAQKHVDIVNHWDGKIT